MDGSETVRLQPSVGQQFHRPVRNVGAQLRAFGKQGLRRADGSLTVGVELRVPSHDGYAACRMGQPLPAVGHAGAAAGNDVISEGDRHSIGLSALRVEPAFFRSERHAASPVAIAAEKGRSMSRSSGFIFGKHLESDRESPIFARALETGR